MLGYLYWVCKHKTLSQKVNYLYENELQLWINVKKLTVIETSSDGSVVMRSITAFTFSGLSKLQLNQIHYSLLLLLK